MTKGKDLENDYFIRENAVSKHKADMEREQKKHEIDEEKLKALHFMKCSKCGHDLETKRMTYVDVEQCTSCGALVIEANQIDKFIAEEKSILKSLIDLFN